VGFDIMFYFLLDNLYLNLLLSLEYAEQMRPSS